MYIYAAARWGDLETRRKNKKGKKNLSREFVYDFISATDILKSLMSDGT
jgi:hypothetical protein